MPYDNGGEPCALPADTHIAAEPYDDYDGNYCADHADTVKVMLGELHAELDEGDPVSIACDWNVKPAALPPVAPAAQPAPTAAQMTLMDAPDPEWVPCQQKADHLLDALGDDGFSQVFCKDHFEPAIGFYRDAGHFVNDDPGDASNWAVYGTECGWDARMFEWQHAPKLTNAEKVQAYLDKHSKIADLAVGGDRDALAFLLHRSWYGWSPDDQYDHLIEV